MDDTQNRLTVGDGFRFGLGMMLVPIVLGSIFLALGLAGAFTLPGWPR